MRDLVRAAANVQKFLDRKRWKYCFIGGLAVQKWGQVRITQDIDLTLFTGLGGEEHFIDGLLEQFVPRIPDARAFAIRNRVLLLMTADGVPLDISCGAFPFEEAAIGRARKVAVVAGTKLKLCTAEDLIIYKAFANRAIDWLDIEGVIAKQRRSELDWGYITGHVKVLAALKEEPGILVRLKALKENG
jgi:hypothetical protein